MTRRQLGMGSLAFSAAAAESALMVLRTQAIVADHAVAAASWDALLGALILAGVWFIKTNFGYALPLVGGYWVGTWLVLQLS